MPALSPICYFFFYCYGAHRDLHSFPTRRSSDLSAAIGRMAVMSSTSGWRSEGRAGTVAFLGSVAKMRSEEHTSELQSQSNLVCRLLLEKKNIRTHTERAVHDRPHG